MHLYVIFDEVAVECGPPFMAKTNGVALRNFGQFQQKTIAPDDHTLMIVGDIDVETCVITACEPRIVMATLELDENDS